MEATGRPCDLCGNSDLNCYVCNSAIAAMSENVCVVCNAMSTCNKQDAEYIGADSEHLTFYENDRYYTLAGKHVKIKLKDGTEFDTRSEYVKHLNK